MLRISARPTAAIAHRWPEHVPQAVRPDTYNIKTGFGADVFDTVGDENLNGPKAVAVPGR